VKLLLDTQLLLWVAVGSPRLPGAVADMLDAVDAYPMFSAASIWEVAIKAALGRVDFDAEPHALRRGLLDNGYEEIVVTGLHGAYVAGLPPIHRDPFDRLLVAQASVEGVTLLTVDRTLALYPGPIQVV
jgi:PIN domain nuclease of toxin-antitoxin system